MKATKPKKVKPPTPDELETIRRELATRHLYDFVVQAWHVLEHDEPYSDNWHIKALCDHLEAVTDHRIPNLLVNVPPGTMKSLLVCVFWVAWVWATQPGKRFMASSYAEDLAMRDSMRCRSLLASQWYQERWPLAFSDSQDAKGKFENEFGGWRMVGSIGGKGIGEHPDFNICLAGDTKVLCKMGKAVWKSNIKTVVEEMWPCYTLSFNHKIGKRQWRKVVNYTQSKPVSCCVVKYRKHGSKDVCSITCTKEHPFWVERKGYVAAENLKRFDPLVIEKHCWAYVESVEDAPVTPEFVYNLEVEGNNNFFANGVLVHNCDDPHNVLKAESDADRQTVTRWVEGVFMVRGVVRDVARVIIMQRLHAQDTSGVVLEKGGWCHICLPMRYEKPDEKGVARMPKTLLGWQDPRKVDGELLWPDKYTELKVANMEATMGLYGAAGQLQQRPSPRGGGTFRRDWFLVLYAVPSLIKLVRYWDKAGTEGGTGAETAGCLMARFEDPAATLPAFRNKYIILDIITGRWKAAQREAIIKQTAGLDASLYGNRVETWVEQEPGSGGLESAQSTVSNLDGFICKIERVTGSKEVRAEPFASQASVGNVRVYEDPRGANKWIQRFLDEAEMFPAGKLKDMIDASGGAFNKLNAASGAFSSVNQLFTGSEDRGGVFEPDRLEF